MPHIILLGDSIFDNASYTGGKPDVITQLRDIVPPEWKATLLAVDGATTAGIPSQLARLPQDATHLVLSVGGNDALAQSDLLDRPARSTAQAVTMLADATRAFENAYRKTVALCLERNLPLTLCTIYNGNFPDADFQKRATAAVAVYNDAIIRVAAENRLTVIELRRVCDKPEDYANPIEPSSIGGAKIARAILRVIGDSGDTGYYARVTA
jgi:lysophospholipase L1-like esterase